MAKRVKVPIVILTGFLGSGKTTLLANWVQSPEFDGAMVIVNELGEVGLDNHLLTTTTESETPLVLENGCACCAAAEDLTGTLERLFWDRLHRKIPAFKWVLIETTGIADPGPIVEMLKSHPLISERYGIAGVVTTFDTLTGGERIAEFPECRRQVALADLVIITKSDLATPSQREGARDIVARSAPAANVLLSANGNLEAAAIIPSLTPGRDREPKPRGPEAPGATTRQHQTDPDRPPGQTHAHHRDGVTTAFLEIPQEVPWQRLLDRLPAFLEVHRDTLLRLKGSIRLTETGTYMAIQAMPNQKITRTPLPVGPDALNYKTGLTLIAHKVDANSLALDLFSRLELDEAAERPHPVVVGR